MSLDLIDKCDILENYYQLHLRFKTGDAMGANFINSCLEHLAKSLIQFASKDQLSNENNKPIDVLMSILSNYVPECLVHAEVSCSIKEFNLDNNNSFVVSYCSIWFVFSYSNCLYHTFCKSFNI